MKGLDNLGQNPLKGLFMWRCALRGKNRGKAAAYRHLLILMELSETICLRQGLVLNILLEGRWNCSRLFFLFVLKGGSSSNEKKKQYCRILYNICTESGLGCDYTFWIEVTTSFLNKIICLKAQKSPLMEILNRSAMWSSVLSAAPPVHYGGVSS